MFLWKKIMFACLALYHLETDGWGTHSQSGLGTKGLPILEPRRQCYNEGGCGC